MITKRTFSFHYYDDRLFELCKEAGEVYTAALKRFWQVYKEEGKWLSKFDLQKEMKGVIDRKNLCSDSFIAAMQQVHNNIASWKQAKKIVPDAKPPWRDKFLQPIIFKEDQIKFKDGKLRLTLDKNQNYIYLVWSPKIPIPTYARVGYNNIVGWHMDLTIETEAPIADIDIKKGMSVDLGVKRIAALFDGDRVITLNGKKHKQIVYYRNKTNAEYMEKLSRKKDGSNNKKKLKRARRKAVEKLRNIEKDMLHKESRFIEEYAKSKGIGYIVVGDNASTHDHTRMRKKDAQMVQQFPEQKLKNMLIQKHESVSGKVDVKPEPYTSQKCPCCETKKKTSTRIYKCKNKECKFVYDRDGVGAINIFSENVSLVEHQRIRRLARPFGIKFDDHLSFKHYAEQLSDLPNDQG